MAGWARQDNNITYRRRISTRGGVTFRKQTTMCRHFTVCSHHVPLSGGSITNNTQLNRLMSSFHSIQP